MFYSIVDNSKIKTITVSLSLTMQNMKANFRYACWRFAAPENMLSSVSEPTGESNLFYHLFITNKSTIVLPKDPAPTSRSSEFVSARIAPLHLNIRN
jgi:hypothetical protein